MTHALLPVLETILAGAILASLADWLFAGVLFHGRYQKHPEVWRAGVGEGIGERGRIIGAQLFTVLTSTAFVLLADKMRQTDLAGAVKLAAMIWLIAPVPMLAANHLFIKIDLLVTISHATGWLVKLLLVAAAVAFLLR